MHKGPGASSAEWTHFSLMLGLTADLLRVVSRADAKISPTSTLKSLGKTPSKYNKDGQVVGIAHWTSIHSSDSQIDLWSKNHDYGICLQTRHIRAIDIDCDDLGTASKIRARIAQVLGVSLPARGRPGSARVVLACASDGVMAKRVIRVADGAIEFLADGQQFIVAGTHPSGGRYFWEGGLPAEFPEVPAADLQRLLDDLESTFGVAGSSGPKVHGDGARSGGESSRKQRNKRVSARGESAGASGDGVVQWLEQRGWSRGEGRYGELMIHCPWEEDHTSDSGETETVYYPAGTNGFEAGHFKCLHAHCAHKTDAQFLDAVGWRESMASEIEEIKDDDVAMESGRRTGVARAHDTDRRLGAPAGGSRGAGNDAPVVDIPDDPTAAWSSPIPGQGLSRGRQGWLATVDNICKALRTPGWNIRLGYDVFRGEVMYCDWRETVPQWRSFTDEDYTRSRVAFDKAGFMPVGREVIRDAVALVARDAEFDSAQVWLDRLKWDGVPRIDRFWSVFAGSVDTPYVRAVAAYYWTLAAGRVMVPGLKGDMVPILVGKGGVRKTTLVASMVPGDEYTTRIDLNHQDADLARKLRGKLNAEIAELRGLHTKGSEAIKDFISATKDDWVPKYREFATSVKRRFVLVGTTDKTEFLGDDAGNERRWLPLAVGVLGAVDTKGVQDVLEQLWAEGAERFVANGVEWEEAQRLAPVEHDKYGMEDSWSEMLAEWMETACSEELSTGEVDGKSSTWRVFGFTSKEALMYGIGLTVRDINRSAEMRLAKVLSKMGGVKVRGSRKENGAELRTWRFAGGG
jgi:hypothetical protein